MTWALLQYLREDKKSCFVSCWAILPLLCIKLTKFAHLTLTKITKFVATRCHILRRNSTKFDFGCPPPQEPHPPLLGPAGFERSAFRFFLIQFEPCGGIRIVSATQLNYAYLGDLGAVKARRQFLSRVSILTRDIDIANLSVHLSLFPSVTFRYQMKTA